MPQGTGLGLYGYKWDTQNKKRVPLEFEVKIVRKVFEMRANGMKPLAIASELNKQGILTKTGSKWHGTVIRRMLENEAYIGKTYFGKHRGGKRETRVKLPQSEWKLLKNTTPAIVSEDLFSRAQQLMAEAKAWHGTHNKHQYLLRGHIVCGHCGKNMLGSGWYKGIEYRYRYYRCGGTNANAEKIQTCNAPQIPADRLETIVWDNIRKTLEKPEVVLAEVKRQLEYKQEDTNTQAVAEAIKQIKHRLNSYATQEKQLLKLFRYGEITEDATLDEINQLKQERETDKKQLVDLTSTKTKLVDLDKAEAGVGEFCAIARKALANVSFEDKCLALDMLGIKVTATKDNIEVKGFLPSEAESWCLGTNIPMSVQW